MTKDILTWPHAGPMYQENLIGWKPVSLTYMDPDRTLQEQVLSRLHKFFGEHPVCGFPFYLSIRTLEQFTPVSDSLVYAGKYLGYLPDYTHGYGYTPPSSTSYIWFEKAEAPKDFQYGTNLVFHWNLTDHYDGNLWQLQRDTSYIYGLTHNRSFEGWIMDIPKDPN